MTLPAFIYARYSSLEQGRGTSLVRQFENGRKYAGKKGWLLDPGREISDKGRSAFHGANRAPGGELHKFERQVEQGFYRNGAVFVCEHFDRISRQGWEQVHAFLKLCTENGVSVATIDSNRFYPAGQRIDGGTIMELVFKSEGAREESKKKSDKGLFNWEQKIKAIQAGDKRTNIGLTPAWIDREPQTNEMTLNPHRSAVLQEIYELYADGIGLPGIARLFNGRKEPSWGYGKKAASAGWNTAYLHKLLTYRSALGEYEANSRTHSGSKETSKGIRVEGHYPQAISAELFNRVEAARLSRRRTGGPGEAKINNLFSGSAICSVCDAQMYFQSQMRVDRPTAWKSRKDGRAMVYQPKTARSYLMCNNNRRKHLCENSARIRYEYLEPAILDAVLTVVMDDKRFTMDDRVAALSANVAEAERLIQGKQHNLSAIVASISKNFVEALAVQAGVIEKDIKADQAQLDEMRDELRKQTGSASPSEQLERVREVRASLNSGDKDVRYSARSKVKQALAQLVKIECNAEGHTHVYMISGAMRWEFDRQGNLVQHADHLNEQPVRIMRERNYQAEDDRRIAGGEEFTADGKFMPIWRNVDTLVPASDRLVQGLKHDNPKEAQAVDKVLQRKQGA